MIEWNKYVDYIFCLQYLHNNRLNEITKTLTNLGINVYDSKFFSFVYDFEHCIFMNQYQNMKEESFNFFNENKYYEGSHLDINQHNYIFYLGFNTYRALKIAQYFNYDRIIIFEDDIKFLKDINYIIDAMNFVKTQDFDICMCQTTFMEGWHGDKDSYIIHGYAEDIGSDMFVRTKFPMGLFGGGFIIFTNKGINKIIKFYEDNNLMVCIDALDTLRDKMNLNTLYALKPLCIQENFFNDPYIDRMNKYIDLNNYDK